MTSDNGIMYMPVAPAYGANSAGGMGLDGLGGGWGLLILLIVLGGWGRNGGFGFGGGSGNAPVIVNNSDNDGYSAVQRGFDQAAIISGINTVSNAVTNGFAQAEVANNNRQMADMQQNFALQSSFQNCCCENRLATQSLQTAIAQDGAATRQAMAQGIQGIHDKLCQLELDGVKQNYESQLRGAAQNYENRIAALENALAQSRSDAQSLRFAASQGAQTAQILANNEAQTNALEQYLAPTPRPAYVVQNPNCCGNAFGNCGFAAA